MQTYGSDHEVLHTARDWLRDGHEVALVTVIKTWGSSPRPAGSLLVMRGDGIHSGSVSGGCVEEDLVQRYRDRQLGEPYPVQVNYGVDNAEATRFGLPCGGRLALLVEQLDDIGQLDRLLDALQRQQLVARRVELATGEVTLEMTAPGHDGDQHREKDIHREGDGDFICTDDYLRKRLGPQWTLLLIGAGHLSQYVSQMALLLDYRVIVCDPREEYAQNWTMQGTELVTMMPDEAVQQYTQGVRSIVVALTHDPKLDDMALLDALASPAFYVGAIGSKRNCEARRHRLAQLGLDASQIKRLHAPVGLDIGSHTPAEIAVSILAQITSERNAHHRKQPAVSNKDRNDTSKLVEPTIRLA